ncbi:hypothetical protein AJ88_24275 [Mesorhizobium amorphae CCBAU 01583]|nr:hypothetical protein AJ88_24275 [Mesorhizobium amorphae CCBAU 01583]
MRGWDEDLLAEELQALLDVDVDLDFSAEITGFSIAEIDHLVEGLVPEEQGNPKDDALHHSKKVQRDAIQVTSGSLAGTP